MYPRNSSSPPRIAIGPVVQISDGAVQTSGVSVRIIPAGGSETDGAGTVAYSDDGVVLYTPTQSETNYTSFVLIAKKSGCIPASVSIVTTASPTAGYVHVGSIAPDAVDADSVKENAVAKLQAGLARQPWIDAEDYGVNPAADPDDNAAWLQAALNDARDRGGLEVRITTAGTYVIGDGNKSGAPHSTLNTCLVIGNGVTLSIAPGVVLKQEAGTNCYLLRNEDAVNGNTNITLCGGGSIDANNQTTPNGNNEYNVWYGDCTQFRRVNGLVIRDLTWLNALKYCIFIKGCTRFHVHTNTFNTNSDCVHVEGPSYNGIIETLSATAGDDTIGLIPDNGNYRPLHRGTGGDIRNIIIRGIEGRNSANLVSIRGPQGYTIENVSIRDLNGIIATGRAVGIALDVNFGDSVGSTIKNISIDQVDVSTPVGAAAIGISAPLCKTVTIGKVVCRSNGSCVEVLNGVVMDYLSIEEMQHPALGNHQAFLLAGNIKHIRIGTIVSTGVGETGISVRVAATGVADRIDIGSITQSLGHRALAIDGTLGQANIETIKVTGTIIACSVGGVTNELNLNNVQATWSTTSNGYIVYVPSGGTLRWLNGMNWYQDRGLAMVGMHGAAAALAGRLTNLYHSNGAQSFYLGAAMNFVVDGYWGHNMSFVCVTTGPNAAGVFTIKNYRRTGTGSSIVYINAGTCTVTRVVDGNVAGVAGANNAGSQDVVVGDVAGKVLGGGSGTITGAGVWALDGSGNAIAPAATALSTTHWTNQRASYLDKLNVDGNLLSTTQWTNQRAGYLDKLNVDGTLAHTGNAQLFWGTGASVMGPGSDHVTIRLTEDGTADGTPVADADVWISTDAAGANVIAGTLQTNSAGEVVFLLDAGVTYYLWAQKDRWKGIHGARFVAVAD